METYINICAKKVLILNSLEFRLFLDIEEQLGIYLQPLLILGDFELDENFPVSCSYWEHTNCFFVLTSSYCAEKVFAFKSMLSQFF